MKKRLFKLGIALALPLVLMGCGSDNSSKKSNDKLEVTVSINPIKEFAEIIGGDKINIKSIVPDNVEAHDFELKTSSIKSVSSSDLFIYNGANMEDWLDDLKKSVSDDVTYVDASSKSEIIKKDGKEDPHLWLSLKEAGNQSKVICDALVKADPDNKEYYEKNYEDFKKQLDDLYNEYKPLFDSIKLKDFITGHAAFGYLCRDFGLEQKSLTDMFNEGETTAKTYETLAKYCNENGIKTIFSENSETSKEAETLANEIKGKVERIYSLESSVKGKGYIEAMKINLEKIYKALIS